MEDFKTYANSFQAKSRLGLESIRWLTEKCGNPQNKLKFIHVAGTNGKGSVCAFLQCILTGSGLKTGKFISPNMIDVCERISIDCQNISEEELDKLLKQVENAAEAVREDTGAMPTQFEIWTAAAFLYFEKNKCDIVVLETGLGGRLDATNIIESPICSVITKIDIDHTEYLGDTLRKIAAEKAGIIKENSTVITTVQDESVLSVLENTAKEKHSDFHIASSPENHRHEGMSEIFDLKELKSLKINLAGLHQTENAALAAEVAAFLGIGEEHIRSGLEKARNIGRFEKMSDNPTVIFDGAHNQSGTQSLIAAVERYFPGERLSLVYACMADKDIDGSLSLLKEHGFSGRAQVFTVTVKDNPRAEDAQRLADKFTRYGFCAYPCQSIEEAYRRATEAGNITIICGSLYLYKDYMEMNSLF